MGPRAGEGPGGGVLVSPSPTLSPTNLPPRADQGESVGPSPPPPMRFPILVPCAGMAAAAAAEELRPADFNLVHYITIRTIQLREKSGVWGVDVRSTVGLVAL